MTAQELLRDAAREIDAALAQLDTHSTECQACGRKNFRNLAHARTHEQLTDLPERLRRAAEKITDHMAPIAAREES